MPNFNMVAETKSSNSADQPRTRSWNNAKQMGTPVEAKALDISTNSNSFNGKLGSLPRENNYEGDGSSVPVKTLFPRTTLRSQTYRPSIRGGRGGSSAGRISSRSAPLMSGMFTTPGTSRYLGHDFNATSDSELKSERNREHLPSPLNRAMVDVYPSLTSQLERQVSLINRDNSQAGREGPVLSAHKLQ